MLKWSVFGCLVLLAGKVWAAEEAWTPLETNIQCKTIHAKLVSSCIAIREDDEPGLCRFQTLQFFGQAQSAAIVKTLLKTDPTVGMQSRFASDWHCFVGPDKQEYLSIKVFNWLNTQDELVILFDNKGRKIDEAKERALFFDKQWWSGLNDNDRVNVTAKGEVNLPAFRQ